MYRPPNWDKTVEPVLEKLYPTHRVLFDAGADAMLEALKAQGRYCRLHRTFRPPGYSQPLRVPGWRVFIPEKPEGETSATKDKS